MIHTAQDQGQHEIHQTWALLMLLFLIIHISKLLFLMLIYFYYGQNGLKIFFICYVSDELALSLTWYLRLGRDDRSMLFNSYDSDELAEFLMTLGPLKLTIFETRFWARDMCHVDSEDTTWKPWSFNLLKWHRSYGCFSGGVLSRKIQKIGPSTKVQFFPEFCIYTLPLKGP